MLVLSRKMSESIVISGDITIKVVQIRGNCVRLGIEAPADVAIHRGEVQRRIEHDPGRQLRNATGLPA